MLVNGTRLAFAAVQIDLREHWWIGDVEIPTRLVLAPMAGVSVQAFRRQGRRYGAGLVCSEMVSCAGIEHRNERTLGYLRVAADEHPLAIQLFGCEPGPMAEAARMVQTAFVLRGRLCPREACAGMLAAVTAAVCQTCACCGTSPCPGRNLLVRGAMAQHASCGAR
jgi:hypothetical protein